MASISASLRIQAKKARRVAWIFLILIMITVFCLVSFFFDYDIEGLDIETYSSPLDKETWSKFDIEGLLEEKAGKENQAIIMEIIKLEK